MGLKAPGFEEVLQLRGQREVGRGRCVFPERLSELELLVEGKLKREARDIGLRHDSSILQASIPT